MITKFPCFHHRTFVTFIFRRCSFKFTTIFIGFLVDSNTTTSIPREKKNASLLPSAFHRRRQPPHRFCPSLHQRRSVGQCFLTRHSEQVQIYLGRDHVGWKPLVSSDSRISISSPQALLGAGIGTIFFARVSVCQHAQHFQRQNHFPARMSFLDGGGRRRVQGGIHHEGRDDVDDDVEACGWCRLRNSIRAQKFFSAPSDS